MAEVLVLLLTAYTLPGIQGMPLMLTYTELLPDVWSPFCSSVLVFGIWKYWFSNEGGDSARLAPLFYSCCVTLEWSFVPLASLIPLLKSHRVGY